MSILIKHYAYTLLSIFCQIFSYIAILSIFDNCEDLAKFVYLLLNFPSLYLFTKASITEIEKRGIY